MTGSEFAKVLMFYFVCYKDILLERLERTEKINAQEN